MLYYIKNIFTANDFWVDFSWYIRPPKIKTTISNQRPLTIVFHLKFLFFNDHKE